MLMFMNSISEFIFFKNRVFLDSNSYLPLVCLPCSISYRQSILLPDGFSLKGMIHLTARIVSNLKSIVICSGLVRYLHPSNERLKEAIASVNSIGDSVAKSTTTTNNNTKESAKNARSARRRRHQHQEDNDKPETFNVPRNLSIALNAEPLSVLHLIQLPYYTDLQWLIDFSLCTVIVYFSTETYFFIFPAKLETEYNLSLVWCLLSLAFTM